jgi:hypothetical protein
MMCSQAKALQENCDELTKELDMLKLKYGQAQVENRRISEELHSKKEKVLCLSKRLLQDGCYRSASQEIVQPFHSTHAW